MRTSSRRETFEDAPLTSEVEEKSMDARQPKKFLLAAKQVTKNLKSEKNERFSKNSRARRSLTLIRNWNIRNFCWRNIYIVTNFSMMIWSIVFHSWLGFVLLIWANFVWIMKNKRQTMMNSSPILVFYALCLLSINYVFNWKLTEDELPTQFGINLKQIGFVRYESYPCLDFLFKSVLMISFWVTLRLMLQEREVAKQNITFKLVETIQVMMEENRKTKLNEETKVKILKALKKICVHAWMWMIVFTLFAMGAFGEFMTLFRVVNMTFFLVFILVFQISIKLWTKSMYIFWLTLIIYAMFALAVIYVYQFDNFPLIPWQNEIGLRKISTDELFLKLFSFTLVIFLTGVQLNSFHELFLEWMSGEPKLTATKIGETSTDESTSVRIVKFMKNNLDLKLSF